MKTIIDGEKLLDRIINSGEKKALAIAIADHYVNKPRNCVLSPCMLCELVDEFYQAMKV